MEFILYFFHRLYPFTFLCLEITKTIIEPTLFGIYIVEQVLGLQGFITNDVSDAINIFSLIFLYVFILLPPWHFQVYFPNLEYDAYMIKPRCSFPVTLVYSALLYHRHHTYNKQRDTELLSGSAETAARSKSTCDDGREESNSQEIHEMALLQRTALETEGRPLCEMA